ncbi:cysteine--tRNA ligase [Marinibactrum halimedae]|uniref:Cysteine--tRNA ligase n=1 Tax=Marinibactrum halimedae TaxID=1444977 RepID=A0AA37T5S4_9GAMM|nr:cysteine--tRNA ligase [Marinibactrum halimedae]MCD9461186.1 cysteine--tRNA ligase [Marinibactrum halimedae]GLS26191.1 cysteine--tRNA ligase [Marinibactrum halimedae]
MTLHLYNTKARTKQVFQPLDSNNIKMYVCGPTVYNFVHIGNARPVVVFDTLFRVLQAEYPKVTYARNITDIDDKIMKAAKENNEPIRDLAERFANAYKEDMAALNNLEPTITPYATDHIGDMIELVSTLVEKGHAYEAQGHVLFAVQSMEKYGSLSNRSLEDMLDGARVEVAPYKKYAGDFVLWKPSASDEPGWESPWGYGRPGWHLECSAMIKAKLGKTIDIHGGGRDLIFPHHENEEAQSCCAHDGEEYVRYWMHNGYLNIDGEKMSKSLGNFRTVRDLLESYRGEVLRFALLSAQYRSELDFTTSLLDQAKTALDGLYGALREVEGIDTSAIDANIKSTPFYQALLDDLNTPIAISELHQMGKALNKANDDQKPLLKAQLLAAGDLLGLLQSTSAEWFQKSGDSELSAEEIEGLIQERLDARAAKNFARSDEIRDYLKSKSVILEDSKEGTQWRFE